MICIPQLTTTVISFWSEKWARHHSRHGLNNNNNNDNSKKTNLSLKSQKFHMCLGSFFRVQNTTDLQWSKILLSTCQKPNQFIYIDILMIWTTTHTVFSFQCQDSNYMHLSMYYNSSQIWRAKVKAIFKTSEEWQVSHSVLQLSIH